MLASEDSDSITAEIAKFAAIGATDSQIEQMLCKTPMSVFNLAGRAAGKPPSGEQFTMERKAGFVV